MPYWSRFSWSLRPGSFARRNSPRRRQPRKPSGGRTFAHARLQAIVKVCFRFSSRFPPRQLSCDRLFRHNRKMFARKIRVQYEQDGQRVACPLKWLDSFSMRNFTNDQVFDDTIPTGDGAMEIGTRVPLERLRSSMEE